VTRATAVAQAVSASRLARLIDDLARIGARPEGGIDRQAFSPADLAARRFIVEHARSLGCETFQDSAGNLFLRRRGERTVAPIATGSHIDTQPIGGKLDGAYGVCAGLEAIAALNDAGLRTRHPVDVVVWANEEGCRFSPGCTGSAAFVDPARLDAFMNIRDAQGERYGDCLERARRSLGDVPLRDTGSPLACFVELHIEQGPVLEKAKIPIGVVESVQGVRWFRVRSSGRAAHAGTTPFSERKDALRPLAALMQQLYACAAADAALRMTIGVVETRPGSINTIAGEAHMTLDIRHAEEEVLAQCEALLLDYAATPRHGCELGVEKLMDAPTTRFESSMVESVRSAASALGLASMPMVSGAFHDAVHLTEHCPTGMIFVPSRDGISHNSEEHTDPEHLLAGAKVLAAVLVERAGQ
jgi:N-carbamoyl-L-amino-acid hydrolase